MLIGERISGRYKIVEIIGGGGMANVYLAQDMILDREVAIKILRLDFANEDEFIHRFQREAQSATSLDHPNIVTIYDVGEEDDIYYIVMEFVDGMTLKQYIQKYHPLSVEKTLDIMKQISSGISHAHENHIIHRDIKPQNILIDHDGNVKITDFGIATALSATSITQTNSVIGSVHYLSPEQARGGLSTKKSDIYSLGIVLFEMLTGRLPFSGESAVSIALKHLQLETPSLRRWNPNIPQSVENIVLKATAKDPFQRYDQVEDLEEDLKTALDANRLNEPKFTISEDDEETKVIPVIGNDTFINDDEDYQKNKATSSKDDKNIAKDKKNKSKKRKWPWVIGLSTLFLVLLAIFALFIAPSIFDPKEIEVPDVSDKKLDEASKTMKDAGFEIGETMETTNEEIDEGNVIRTSPKAGKLAKEGASIDFYVSTGPERFVLADYTDRQYEDIVDLLKDEDFKEIVSKEVPDESPAGTILEQDPPKGEEVIPEETTLTFTVSQGLEKVPLEDLTIYDKSELDDYADETGLSIKIEEEHSDTVEKGKVISQSPAPGTELVKGEKVEVIVSKGESNTPPKTVSKEITIPYEPKEDGHTQEIQLYVEDMNNEIDELFETFTITEETKKRIDLTIEKGKKGSYKVIRDETVIIDEQIPYPDD